MDQKSEFMQRLQDYFKGKQPDARQKQLDEIENSDPTQNPALPSQDALKKTQDSLRKAFGTPTSQLEPEYRKRMRGMVRGAEMQPSDLENFQEQQKQGQLDSGPRGGVSDSQWQAAQDKLDEILAKQPKLDGQPSRDQEVDPNELQNLNPNEVLDDAKIRALQKMRGSGTPPQGL